MKDIFVNIFIFILIAMPLKCEEKYKICIGIFNLKEVKTQTFILELKKMLPAEIKVLFEEVPKYASEDEPEFKVIILESFSTEKEAKELNKKIKKKFPKIISKSYVVKPEILNAQGKNISIASKNEFRLAEELENRTTENRQECILEFGGSEATESAVESALIWLANHQEKDGHWDSGKYEGAGTSEVDNAITGLALLAFLGAGYTDHSEKYQINVTLAIKWLLINQRLKGDWDGRDYTNAICTMALAEAISMGCKGSGLQSSTRLAVRFVLSEQNLSGGFSYRKSTEDEMCITGWCISSLKSALIANIYDEEINLAFKKCSTCFDNTEGTNDNKPTSKGLAWYMAKDVGTGKDGGACQAIAMLIRQTLGWGKLAPWLQAASQSQIMNIPANYTTTDVYRVYYSYVSLFQQGGNYWKIWNEKISKLIVDSQRQDDDFKGSWDKNGCKVDKGGRVMYTAMLCLALETYYRYKINIKE